MASVNMQTAPAKLTVTLKMVGLRDDGYHLIESEMVSVSLVDHLGFDDRHHSTPGGLRLSSRSSVGVDVSEDNLVCRAMRAVGRKASVQLEKHIPLGAGLGGGSADAAAVLRWADCWDIDLAATLGADVPFCLRGGRAEVGGVGEKVTRLSFEPRDFTLLTPPVHVDTAAVYRAFDEMGESPSRADNDLEAAALAVEPTLGRWRDRLARWTGESPHLAGSGATWFVAGHHVQPNSPELEKARWMLVSTTPGFD